MRNLATIQKIANIRPIAGADRIVVADVLGWSVVVGKDEFQIGDYAVYFEIDSWCDSSIPAFQSDVFVARYTNWGDKRGMRLKTIKLRKQLSQGLLMPLGAFPELTASVRGLDHPQEGEDVTEILKIEKWEALEEVKANGGPNKTAGAGKFPSFIRKTDQERIQNYINELPRRAHETFEVTIKLDGSSMTVFALPQFSSVYAHAMEDIDARLLRGKSLLGKLWHKFGRWAGFNPSPEVLTGVCSRNIELPVEESNHFSTYVRKYGLLEALENYCAANYVALALQGELIAPSIQENYEKMEDFGYFVYDIFDIDAQCYLKPKAVRQIIDALGVTGVDCVPVLAEEMPLADFVVDMDDPRKMVDAILVYAEGPGMNPGVKREGVVFKSNDSDFSFKAISNSYLLAKEGK